METNRNYSGLFVSDLWLLEVLVITEMKTKFQAQVYLGSLVLEKACSFFLFFPSFFLSRKHILDFPHGPVAKNTLASAGAAGSIPGLERSHMPWGN